MTSTQIPSRMAMKCPFAASGSATDIADSDGDSINFSTGFPSVYAVPASQGGKYLGRADMNAIGKMATNDIFYHKCGGLNTFDSAFVSKIGGYPKGAVLDYVTGEGIVRRIRSLVDNNTTDPRESGIDDINWSICDSINAYEGDLIYKSSYISPSSSILGFMLSPADINLFRIEVPDIVPLHTLMREVGSSANYNFWSGVAYIIKDLGTSLDSPTAGELDLPEIKYSGTPYIDYKNWKLLAGSCVWRDIVYSSEDYYYTRTFGSVQNGEDPGFYGFAEGHYYAVAVFGDGMKELTLSATLETTHYRHIITYEQLSTAGSLKIYRGAI